MTPSILKQLHSAPRKLRLLVCLGVSLLALLSSRPAHSFETSYWAWQRNEPPGQSELAELSRQGVTRIYWQIGQLENMGNSWHWQARFKLPAIPHFEVVPVVRLESREHSPFTPEATQALLRLLSSITKGQTRLQIDYDCPDRLLPEYATILKKIRTLIPELTITALPAWIRQPALSDLGNSVTEMLPMFYDFAPDPVTPGSNPTPLVDPVTAAAWLAEWKTCKTPWRAGMPNFARLTVYDPDGKSHGHIREWNWDSVCFNETLSLERVTKLGVTLFRARADTRIGNTLLRRDQLLAARWPDRGALSELIIAARKSPARGLVIFRLPDSTAASGWSLRQLQQLDATPQLTLRTMENSNQLILTNEGHGDLAPVFSTNPGPLSQGYALQVEADRPIFREAEEGDFFLVRGEIERAAHSSKVMIPLATRLTFPFSQLRAGQSLKSGLISLAPGADFTQTRFRIVHSSEDLWRPFKK